MPLTNRDLRVLVTSSRIDTEPLMAKLVQVVAIAPVLALS